LVILKEIVRKKNGNKKEDILMRNQMQLDIVMAFSEKIFE